MLATILLIIILLITDIINSMVVIENYVLKFFNHDILLIFGCLLSRTFLCKMFWSIYLFSFLMVWPRFLGIGSFLAFTVFSTYFSFLFYEKFHHLQFVLIMRFSASYYYTATTEKPLDFYWLSLFWSVILPI